MNENRRPRKRIHSHVTKSRFLHLEDALDIGEDITRAKIRLFVGEYKRGQGARATAYHFLDLADARVLFSDLAWGKSADGFKPDFKGTANGDEAQSRVLKVQGPKDGKYWLEIINGPGEVVGEGAVKPAGKPDVAVSVPLSVWEARRLAHAALAYIRAWEADHLLDAAPVASLGDTPKAGRATATTPASPAVEIWDVGVVANSVATGQEVPATATDFWTLYNTEGREAGVDYTDAQQIANGAGEDWQKAIIELCAAIDTASAETLD
jgi:hypothetical protein